MKAIKKVKVPVLKIVQDPKILAIKTSPLEIHLSSRTSTLETFNKSTQKQKMTLLKTSDLEATLVTHLPIHTENPLTTPLSKPNQMKPNSLRSEFKLSLVF